MIDRAFSRARKPAPARLEPGRWLRVLSRAELGACLGASVEGALGDARIPVRHARRLRWDVLRRFFALCAERARRVRGLTREEFLRELERSQRGLLRERERARIELEGLRGRLAAARARLEADGLGEDEEQGLARALSADLSALLARAPGDRRGAVADLVRRERERREAALARVLAGHRERIALLERRVAKLRLSLARTEEDLAALLQQAGIDQGIPSIYRSVQGLSETAALRAAKLELLRVIFKANLALQRRSA